MQRSTASRHSQDKNAQTASLARQLKSQRTATSQRTGQSSNHSASNHPKTIEKPSRPRVFDENNCDVTPKPMFEAETQQRIRHGSALFESIAGTITPTETSMSASVMNTNAILTAAQSFSAFPESSTQASMDSQVNMNPSDAPQGEGAPVEKEQTALFHTTVDPIDPKEIKIYEKITFTETPTFNLLNIPQSRLFDEDPMVEQVVAKNKKYLEICKTKLGNDSFVDRGINTFNDLPKIKNTQTERITISEKGAWCTLWDMYDSNLNDSEKKDGDEDQVVSKEAVIQTDSPAQQTSVKKSVATGTITNTVMSEMPSETVEAQVEKKDDVNYMEDENFRLSAFFMERLLNQNTYQSKQARYRGMKPVATETDPLSKIAQYNGLSLEKLWTYTSALTKERNVSCVTWNRRNPDILAAGYGKFEFNDEQSGLVCCWSLKNPEFPERYYKTEAGVTSVAFSQKHANLLAVGLFNGNINIYDVRTNNVTSLLSTSESDNKHLSPVWNLKWTERDRASSTGEEDEMEVLMSISSDGRITQWLIRKGFESSDYLKLKRVMIKDANSRSDKDKSEGLISRNTGGLCFDIWDQDKSIYLCGTEEGNIHRCSTSYNEQYLDTYHGHTGPVYKLAWSPFLKNCFISGSSDWSIKLWKTNRTEPCLSFNSSTKAVYDICWSNNSATIFCCVNENAIEIWDLSKSTLDPIFVTNALAHVKLTSVTYSPNSDSLIVGTNEGSLYVYAIKNTPQPTKSGDLEDIIKLSLISQLDNHKIDEDEANDIAEKHQLESMKKNPKEEEPIEIEPEQDDQKIAKIDEFQANLDKIKNKNANLLKDRKPKDKKNKKSNESSSSDDE